ncbi:MAG: Fic family protein [Candidatus Tectomicrobia bacterium]|nr:Fic family protein [Candidatus Tectomicrobia bacterium]
MYSERSGRAEKLGPRAEPYYAFIPQPLPPKPPLVLDAELLDLSEEANRSLGRLDGVTAILPDTLLFLYFYVRKEALLSSQIEGTQSSLADLLLFEYDEVPGVPLDDVREVSNYVAAMNHGLERIKSGFPLSLRLLREVHGVLLAKGRGSEKSPGEFRTSQNWVGGSRPGTALFVPPPAAMVIPCMGALEKFLHDDPEKTSVLIKAALTHVQFESIHPFLDGNGRLGRLLITLLLCAAEALHEPLLYLSLYFKRNREAYYEHLQRVRTHGEWEAWVRFFLTGVRDTADQAAQTARRILQLFEADQRRIERIGRAAGSCLRVHQYLQRRPLLSIPKAARDLKLSPPTLRTCVRHLQTLGILRETTGRARNRLYAYDRYLAILSEGTEPLP